MNKVYFYNTAARKKQEFTLLKDSVATLYTCGPTVYNKLHIGNWVAYIYWDILVRTLELSGYEVKRVMNITDVGHLVSDADEGEDKMEKGARRENKTAWEIAKMYTDDFIDGMKKLNLTEPAHLTKATEHIESQLQLVRDLKEKGFTYQITDGIYFDTAKFLEYAKFASLNLDALKAGARVEANSEKHNHTDFALWKFTPEGQKRDMEWETPEDFLEDGQKSKMGFPGWHLECSAMAMQYLGETIDIHTGGIDHIPVHHTNEIAQSEAATGKTFANYWLHNAHLLADGTKISKSLNNGYTLKDIVNRDFSPLDFKMLTLQSHYRTEGNFTFENLEAAKNRLLNWRNFANLRWQTKSIGVDETGITEQITDAREAAMAALRDDLNSPKALQIIDEAFARLENNGGLHESQKAELEALLEFIDNAFGLKIISSTPDIDASAKQLIIDRETARENKNWNEADKLRDALLEKNIGLRDTTFASVWYRLN